MLKWLARAGAHVECEWGKVLRPDFFDFIKTKSGCTALLQARLVGRSGFRVPESLFVEGWKQAKFTSDLLKKACGFETVIKPNSGWGGKGIWFTRTMRSLSRRGGDQTIPPCDSKMLVVQRDVTLPGKSFTPSVDFHISSSGETTMLYPENMFTPSGHCSGIELGPGCLEKQMRKAVVKAAHSIIHSLSRLGYVGWGDVDFMATTNRKVVYVSEINGRRTGGTAPIEILQRLKITSSKRFQYMKTWDRFEILSQKITPDGILDTINIIEERFGNNIRIIPLSTQGLRLRPSVFGYAIVGQNRRNVIDAEEVFLKMLKI